TSHICSNQAHLALRCLIHLCTVGEQGLRRLAELNTLKAHYLCERLCALPGVRRAHTGPFFNEFELALDTPATPLLEKLRAEKIFGGLDTSAKGQPRLLVAVTEMKTKAQLDHAAEAFARALPPLSPAS